MILIQSFSVALRVWFGVYIQPTSLTDLNSAYSGTPTRLALGPAFAVMEKRSYRGVLCLMHFKKARTSLPFIFSTGETERWH